MRKIILSTLFVFFVVNLYSATHIVSLSTDNIDTPEEGMLRYAVKNAGSNDTIVFTIAKVELQGEIKIAMQSLVIDGGQGVVIDGGRNGRVFNISFDSYTDISIKNITIQNGYVDDATIAWGGGMYVFGSGDGLVVENCTFINNEVNSSSDGQGGALRAQGGLFKNCYFLNNKITGTGYSNSGGAVMAIAVKFVNCVFAGNSAKHGGGVYATNSTELLNCTITQNTVSSEGDGAGIYSETESAILNTIIYNNSKVGVEQNLINSQNSSSFSFCATDSNNDIVGTNNNIGLIISPFVGVGTDSLALVEGSVCIDKGNPTLSDYPEYDIKGAVRIFGSAIDIGAYEFFVPIVLKGIVKKEEGELLSQYNLHPKITVDANGTFVLIESGEIKNGDTLFLNAAPIGYEFYPNKIIFNKTDSIIITAYKGIVANEWYPKASEINWNTDTVNIFTDVNIDSAALIISAGTFVKFHNWSAIKITGNSTVLAKGSNDSTIRFAPADTSGYNFYSYNNTKGSWRGIRFSDMTSFTTSVFNYCSFKFAKGLNNERFGGALSVIGEDENIKLVLNNCSFINNGIYATMANGGAVGIKYAQAEIMNCNFYNNKVAYSNTSGSALYLAQSTVQIVNCNIIANYTYFEHDNRESGGLYSHFSEVSIYNSIIRDNNNNILNDSVQVNYAFDRFQQSSMNIYNCNIQGGNRLTATRFENCIDEDAMFNDTAKHDFSLQVASPCINMGKTSYIETIIPTTDIFGNQRIVQGHIDMGSAEYQSDIETVISGFVKDAEGKAIANYTIFNNVTTDAAGFYSLKVGESNISEGDTLEVLSAPEGYNFYPSKVIVGANRIKSINVTAYKGLVVDNYSKFIESVTWDSEIVNVFSNVKLQTASLTIKPGVKVVFHGFYGIQVSLAGSIIAEGTLSDSIIFTSSSPELFNTDNVSEKGAWRGIKISDMRKQAGNSALKFCRIEYCKNNYNDGSALFIENFKRVKVDNLTLQKNSAFSGAGLYLSGANVTVTNCNINNNNGPLGYGSGPTTGGAGIYMKQSFATIIGCNIFNNKSSRNGGGVLIVGARPQIVNCNIVANKVPYNGDEGGGIYATGAELTIINSIIWDNQIVINPSFGDAATAEVYNSCIKGGNSFGASVYENCINSDPMFTDTALANYSLQNNSLCINSGSNAYLNLLPIYDSYSNVRVMGKTVDIGAFEHAETSLYIESEKEVYVSSEVLFMGTVVMGTANSWSWDFNNDDIEDANTQEASYTFNTDGTHIIRLIANVNENGSVDTAYFYTSVVYQAPLAAFSAHDTVGIVPSTIQFTDESLHAPTRWLWDFGDGDTSTEQNPSHTYMQTGTYTVSLEVKNSAGENVLTKVEYIEITNGVSINTSPEINFYAFPNPVKDVLNVFASENQQLILMDMAGKVVFSTNTPKHSMRINMKNLPKGIYLLQLKTEKEILSNKIVKQ